MCQKATGGITPLQVKPGERKRVASPEAQSMQLGRSTRIRRVLCGEAPQTSFYHSAKLNGEARWWLRSRRRDAIDGTRDACAPQTNCIDWALGGTTNEMRRVLRVTCYVLRVTCYVLRVTCSD